MCTFQKINLNSSEKCKTKYILMNLLIKVDILGL